MILALVQIHERTQPREKTRCCCIILMMCRLSYYYAWLADLIGKASGFSYNTPIFALKDEFYRIPNARTANAFSTGKTSFEYRRERFASVLTHFGTCKGTLTSSLELKTWSVGLVINGKGDRHQNCRHKRGPAGRTRENGPGPWILKDTLTFSLLLVVLR